MDLPDIGTKFDRLDSMVAVESVKTAADVYAMVDGEITGVNEDLDNEAGLVNHSPEDEGWMVELRVSDKGQLEDLLGEDQYSELI